MSTNNKKRRDLRSLTHLPLNEEDLWVVSIGQNVMETTVLSVFLSSKKLSPPLMFSFHISEERVFASEFNGTVQFT